MNWSKRHFSNLHAEVRRVNRELKKFQDVPYLTEVNKKIRKLKLDLEQLLDIEEVMWRQRKKT